MLGLGHVGGFVAALPYADFQCMLDDPPGQRNYWSAEYLGGLPDDAVAAFCASAEGMIVPSGTQHPLFPQGGAIARGPAEYPIPWRNAPWAVHPFGVWDDPADDDRGRAWAQGVRRAMQPWASGDVYLNFIGDDEGADRTIRGWGRDNYARLARVKGEFDPENVFRLNHNILPA
jgi:FAD/FMN-containing dehydrogenase